MICYRSVMRELGKSDHMPGVEAHHPQTEIPPLHSDGGKQHPK